MLLYGAAGQSCNPLVVLKSTLHGMLQDCRGGSAAGMVNEANWTAFCVADVVAPTASKHGLWTSMTLNSEENIAAALQAAPNSGLLCDALHRTLIGEDRTLVGPMLACIACAASPCSATNGRSSL